MLLSGRVQLGAPQLQRRPQLPWRTVTVRRQVNPNAQFNAHCNPYNSSSASETSNHLISGSALPSSQPTISTAPHLPLVPQHQQPQHEQWQLQAAAGDGSGSSGGSSGGRGGGGGGGSGGGGDDSDDDEILDLTQVEAAAGAAKVNLPADMLETAKTSGLRASALTAYISLQKHAASGLIQRFAWIRNRMIADDKFLFKVLAEVVIDSGCATVAEVRKRGEDFWAEFEFYLSDLLVGIVLDVVLVTLMAPVAVVGGRAALAAGQSGLQKWLAGIPSAALEASVKGVREYSIGSRFACLGVKFFEYSLAGITCGFIGQGIANSLMLLKRQIHGEKEDDVAVPPLMKTALVWGLFMGLSSNIRYQTVFGLERLVDMTIAKRVPAIAYGTTVAIRFVNNVIGGENFIDMARWAGVQ